MPGDIGNDLHSDREFWRIMMVKGWVHQRRWVGGDIVDRGWIQNPSLVTLHGYIDMGRYLWGTWSVKHQLVDCRGNMIHAV
jgi:hypothetical protein